MNKASVAPRMNFAVLVASPTVLNQNHLYDLAMFRKKS